MSKYSKQYINWDQLEQIVGELSHKIALLSPQVKTITGLPRGGLIPAVMISHNLGIPFIDSERLNLYNNPQLSIKDDTILVIDDICDTGKTLQYINKKYLTATLHYKPTVSVVRPDYYWGYAEEDSWIVYPWEREDSDTIQDYLK